MTDIQFEILRTLYEKKYKSVNDNTENPHSIEKIMLLLRNKLGKSALGRSQEQINNDFDELQFGSFIDIKGYSLSFFNEMFRYCSSRN